MDGVQQAYLSLPFYRCGREYDTIFLGLPDDCDNPHPLPVIAHWCHPKSVDSIYYGYGYTYSSVEVRAFRLV